MADRPPVVGYARVSTSANEQLEALVTQQQRLKDAGVSRIITDVQSGLESDRAGYLELLDLIARKAVGEIVITRLDRLGRDASDVDATIAFAAKHGVVLRALDGGAIESSTPAGFALSRVMTTMAELESRMLSLRIRSALKSRRKQGAPLRGRAPWGYRVTEDHQHFEPDPVEWPRVEHFMELLATNDWRSQTTLTQWRSLGLGPMPLNSVSAISHWLVNPVLRGGVGYHKRPNRTYNEVIWGQHQPLLSEEQFRHISSRKQINSRFWGKNVRYRHRLLTGLVRCGHCRKRMSYIPKRNIPSLYCHSVDCVWKYKTVHEAPLVVAINKALTERAVDLAQCVAQEDPEAALLAAAIRELEAKGDPDLETAIQIKRQKIQELHNRPTPDEELLSHLRDPEFWSAATPEELRQLYEELVEEALVVEGEVTQVRMRF